MIHFLAFIQYKDQYCLTSRDISRTDLRSWWKSWSGLHHGAAPHSVLRGDWLNMIGEQLLVYRFQHDEIKKQQKDHHFEKGFSDKIISPTPKQAQYTQNSGHVWKHNKRLLKWFLHHSLKSRLSLFFFFLGIHPRDLQKCQIANLEIRDTLFLNLRVDNRLYTNALQKQFCTSCHNLSALGSQRSKDWTYCFLKHVTQGGTSHRFRPSVCPYGGWASPRSARPEGQTVAWFCLQHRGVERSRSRDPAWRMMLEAKSETLWAGERHSERQNTSITASPSDTVMRTALHKPTHTFTLVLSLSWKILSHSVRSVTND